MRTVIIADGGRDQLVEWLGHYRHLIELDGERLLHRTVRQFAELGDVVILAPDVPEYRIPPASTLQPAPCLEWRGIAMLAKALPHLGDGRTNIVFGDVWFSDDAIDLIAAHTQRDWQVFGRPQPSRITGTPWGEYFCVTLYPEHHDQWQQAMASALDAHVNGGWFRVSPWEVYFYMDGLPIAIQHGNPVHTGEHWTTINDWTDDFDFPEDVQRWRLRRRAVRL